MITHKFYQKIQMLQVVFVLDQLRDVLVLSFAVLVHALDRFGMHQLEYKSRFGEYD
jgi:hypothetical protein